MRSDESNDTGMVVHQCVYYHSLALKRKGVSFVNLPNVPGQMLTSSEAQIAWRKLGTEEPLALFLL